MKAMDLPPIVFLKQAGVTMPTFRKWLERKDSTTARLTISRLAAATGISEAQALLEAGGVTAEDIATARGVKAVAAKFWVASHTKEARRKAGAAMRGRTLSVEHVRAIREGVVATGHDERLSERMKAWHARTDGKILSRLWGLFRRYPTPSREQIEARAERMAPRLEVSSVVVLEIWRPYLRRRGLWPEPSGGRKPLENRHLIVDQYMRARGLTHGQRKPRGFWELAAIELGRRDPTDITDGPTLEAWYRSHTRLCANNYFGVAAVA